MKTQEVYRKFLREIAKLPKQENRSYRFDFFLTEKVKSEFMSNKSSLDASLELKSLQFLNNNQIEAKHNTKILNQYLPGEKTYKLLDIQAQRELNKKQSPFSILAGYLQGTEKLKRS